MGGDSHAESTQKGAAMAEQHVVIVDIDAVIREGLTVYDAGGEKVGVLKDYSPSAAYLANKKPDPYPANQHL
jgi:hypothetical protein